MFQSKNMFVEELLLNIIFIIVKNYEKYLIQMLLDTGY